MPNVAPRIVALRPFVAVVAALPIAFLCACGQKSSPKTTESALTSYESGRYADAKAAAEKRYRDARGPEQETAALTAGLAAYNMDQFGEAERWLAPLVQSSDAEISGKAGATMGLVHQRRGQHASASRYLLDAADKLEGEEQAKARLAAARSLEAVGQRSLAQEQQARARAVQPTRVVAASSTSRYADSEICVPGTICTTCTVVGSPSSLPPLNSGSARVVSSRGYTVQLGAFAAKANAERRAREVRAAASRAGLGSPRIVPAPDASGRTLYMVQVGEFGSQSAATDARRRLGTEGVVTALR